MGFILKDLSKKVYIELYTISHFLLQSHQCINCFSKRFRSPHVPRFLPLFGT